MQLELFCAEDTVRGYEQRITAHAEHERVTRLLIAQRCDYGSTRKISRSLSLASRIKAELRRPNRLWCIVMPRRWSPCLTPS